MTIHHDKLAYGKLASSREDLSEERIFEMLGELESYEEEGAGLRRTNLQTLFRKKGRRKKKDENALQTAAVFLVRQL